MTSSERGYLLFTMQGGRYAIDLSQVAEVNEPPVVGPIPGAPACYTGAMNFHGSIVAVMDLAAFLGLPGYHEPEKVIVLDARIASLAFMVERVIRIAPREQAERAASPDTPFASALIRLPEGEATLLDASAIAQRAAETVNLPTDT